MHGKLKEEHYKGCKKSNKKLFPEWLKPSKQAKGRGMPRNLLRGWNGWGLKKKGTIKKDERGKFIKMDVYAKYCRYTYRS